MLVTARRLWKAAQDEEARSCRLVALEDVLIGNRRVGDVPGFEIPQRYFDFVRSGDPAPLEPVLEHNRLDLLSTALLFGRAQQLVQQGPAGASDAYECLSLARLHERCGAVELADEAYRAAREHPLADRAARERAWYGLAILQRRRRRHEDAAASWRELLLVVDRRSRLAAEAIEALAIHHEHRARNLRTARALAHKALAGERDPKKREALEHRLARLDRKLELARGDQALADTVTTPLPWGE
jgi:tetratricopeptide (TPR) repeat protein